MWYGKKNEYLMINNIFVFEREYMNDKKMEKEKIEL